MYSFSLPTYVYTSRLEKCANRLKSHLNYTSSLKYCADMLQITRILIQASFSLVVLFLVADVCLYFKT